MTGLDEKNVKSTKNLLVSATSLRKSTKTMLKLDIQAPTLQAIDETLYHYRGHINFKQYKLLKPAKYGMFYHSLCDLPVQYTYFTLPYARKPEDLNNEASKFYITGTDEYSRYLVENFNHFNSIKGCNISMDRYFTLITLANWVTTKLFSIVGTICLDRKGIPKEIKSMEGHEEKSTIYAYQSNGDGLLVSYIDKKKAGKKNFVVFTTMHTSVSVTKDQHVKPNIHTFYDHTKGGVDVVNLISTHSTTKMKNQRWPINGTY